MVAQCHAKMTGADPEQRQSEDVSTSIVISDKNDDNHTDFKLSELRQTTANHTHDIINNKS